MQSQTAVSLCALTAELVHNGAFYAMDAKSFPDIVDVRNIYLTLWFDKHPQATHLLFVDADMQFEPNLVVDMLKAGVPLIGCLYPKKRWPIEWVGSAHPDNPAPENGLLELEAVGCGVMLIRRDCVENMLAKGNVPVLEDLSKTGLAHMVDTPFKRILRCFDKITDESGRYLSEDYSFCHRHRASGGKVYAAIEHVICHIGHEQFAARYSDLYKQKSREWLATIPDPIEPSANADS